MNKKILYPSASFILVFLLHGVYFLQKSSSISNQWAQFQNETPIWMYIKGQHFLLSFSYALAGAFTIYAILKFFENRKCSVAGIAGGTTLIGVLYLGGCFLVGCCGSPMLAVYMALFGSSFLGFTKPLIAIVTTISVVFGYIWIEKWSAREKNQNKTVNG